MRLPVTGILMVSVGGILFMLYIAFNSAFTDLRNLLWANANVTMTGSRLTTFGDLMPQLADSFGVACVLCFGIGILIFIVDAFSQPPREM